VVVVALLAANVGLRVAAAAADAGRDAAVDRHEAAAGRRSGQEGLAAAIGERTAAAHRGTERADGGLAHLPAAEGAVDAETAVVQANLDAAAVEVVGATARIDAARVIISTSAGQAEDLRRCLGGIAEAAAASRRGDTPAVVWIMQSVADHCRRARAAIGSTSGRFPYDFPDPFVLTTADGYYAYATNSAGGAIQLLRSSDLMAWSFAGIALSSVPAWAVPGATWAPSVLARGDRFVLFYAVRHRESGRQCISVASGGSPAGPFLDASTGPLVCELDDGGSIDPSPVVAPDGTAYLLWKAEGETAGGRATLRGRRLAADGLTLVGATATLLGVDQAWEGRTVEGPSMVPAGGSFLLLYSANRWDSASYAVGAARCDTPLGPCRKVPGPVLATSGTMTGPGGAEVFLDREGRRRVAFHAWDGDAIGYPDSRFLHIGSVTDAGSRVTVSVD
jgi:hypothetical protein